MAKKKKATTVDESHPPNPDDQYSTVIPPIVEDWTYRPVNKPFYDPEAVAYAIIIQSGKKIKGEIYLTPDESVDTSTLPRDKNSEKKIVKQSTFPHIISEAKERTLKYYNKRVDPGNIELLSDLTIIEHVHISTRPRAPNLFYVTIDAPKFDLIPDLGRYILTPITKESSLYQLAEEYKDFFRITDNTEKGKRARISEILRANGINVLEADNSEVEEWIYRVNYGLEDPPGKDSKFNKGSEIYLPNTEPDFSRVISGGKEIELHIGDTKQDIGKLIALLKIYDEKIRESQFVVKNFDIDRQIKELENFLPRIRTHFLDNDYNFRNFLEDNIRLGLDKDSNLIYIGISSSGSVAYLNKAMPSLALESPFNNPRTMNLLSYLQEIVLLSSSSLPWKDFLSRYISPAPQIVSRDPQSVFEDAQQNTKTILEQLASRFDKFSAKSNRQLGEENSIYGSVQIMNGIFNQQTSALRDTGDAVIRDLANISEKIENPGASACGAGATVYNEVLNKIDFKSLVASAIDCLKEQVPFDCEDIVLAIAEENLDAVAGIFRARINPQYHDILEEALQIATSGDFTLYQIKYEYQFYKPLEEKLAQASEGQIFLGALEYGLNSEGVDYNSLFQEVCSYLSDPRQALSDLTDAFFLPTIFLPDNLPTVDIDEMTTVAFEKMLLELVSSLIVKTVQAVISTLLNRCREGSGSGDGSSSPGYGSGLDVGAAIADNVGAPNFREAMEDLLDSLGTSPWSPALPTGGAFELIESGTVQLASDISSSLTSSTLDMVETESKFLVMQNLFTILKGELTSPEIIRLLEGRASPSLLQVVLNIIHPSSTQPQNEILSPLRDSIMTKGDVEEMFQKIASLVDLGPTIEQVNILSNQLGCSLDDFVSSRVPLWCNTLPPDQTTPVAESVIYDEKENFLDYYRYLWKPSNMLPDPCEDPNTNINTIVPKDSNSFSFMLDKVLKTIFDNVYMAYDSSVLSFPDPMFVLTEEPRKIPRVQRTGAQVSIDYYNFQKLQEEELSFEIPDQFGHGYVINPEFQRLISDGIVPADGDPNGPYGPYTTEKLDLIGRLADILPEGIPLTDFGLDSAGKMFELLKDFLVRKPAPRITVNDTVPELAANSKAALKNIDNLVLNSSTPGQIELELQQPTVLGNVESKMMQYVLQLKMMENNDFLLKIGQFPPDLGALAVQEPVQSENSAFFYEEYEGNITFPATAHDLLQYVRSNTPSAIFNDFQQKADFQRLIYTITRNGIEHYSGNFSSPPNVFNDNLVGDLNEFSDTVMYHDIIRQMFSGISSHILTSPMLRFTGDMGKSIIRVPYLSIVDWSPLPNEDEAACGHDPHILSIDTIRRQMKEDYENKINKIECDDLGNEISSNAQGRKDLSSLEKAIMSGCVLTTLRTYSLEQLLRSMFPVSVFSGSDFMTEVQLKYIVDKVNDNIYDKSESYYDAFLQELERVFGDRMEEFSPYGTIPSVIADGNKSGISWVYAQRALDEFYGAKDLATEELSSSPIGNANLGGASTPTNSDIFQPSSDEEIISQPSASPPTPATGGSSTQPPLSALEVGSPPSNLPAQIEVVDTDVSESLNPGLLEDPCTDLNVPSLIPTTPLRENLKYRIAFLIEEQVYSLLGKLQDLISFKGNLSLDDNFLTKILPLLDTPRYDGDPRFAETGDYGTVTAIALKSQAEEYNDKFNQWKASKEAILRLFRQAPFPSEAYRQAMIDSLEAPDPLTLGRNSIPVLASTDLDGTTFYSKHTDSSDLSMKRELKYMSVSNFKQILSAKLDEFKTWYEDDERETNWNGEFGLFSHQEGSDSKYYWDLTSKGDDGQEGNKGFWEWFFADSQYKDMDKFARTYPYPEYDDFLEGIQKHTPIPNARGLESYSGESTPSFDPSGEAGKLFLERYILTEKQESEETDVFPGTRFMSSDPDSPTIAKEKLGGEINLSSQEIQNITTFAGQMNGIAIQGDSEHSPDSNVADKFKKISFGLRLSYVSPLSPFVPKSDETHTLKVGGYNWKQSFNSTCQEKSKSYVLREEYTKKFTSSEAIGEALESTVGTLQGYQEFGPTEPEEAEQLSEQVLESAANSLAESEIESMAVHRDVMVFPICSVELPIQLSDDLKFKDFFNSLEVGQGFKSKKLEDLFNNQYMIPLVEQMKKSQPYKLLFKYCIPSDPILSATSIYSNIVNELPQEFFSKTKEELKSLFEVALNGGDYTFESTSQRESGGNRGAYARASANYGTDGKARDPSLFDFAIKTPKLIFKGLTEFIDPVIAPASKIVKAANAGMLIPQVMKILNPDGTAGGTNDENYFLTQVAFPRGSIPFPTGDMLGDEVTVIDKAQGFGGASVDEEIVMFRFRDAQLKSSETGNNLFDRYIQNVFMKYKPPLAAMEEYYENASDSALVPESESPLFSEETKAFQRFALGTVKRDFGLVAGALMSQYSKDLKKVRDGVVEELKDREMLTEELDIQLHLDVLHPFSRALFQFLRQASDSVTCGARDVIIGILRGEIVVNPTYFSGMATGFLTEVDIKTEIVSLKTDSPIVDWVIWGTNGGAFHISNPPIPQTIFPGYPLPLPITPVAMSSLPYDMVPYGPGPPHSPLGHIYHAVVAAEGLANVDLDMKDILREEEGLESKKKLRGKLCIDMEQISAEERKRRGLE